MGVQRGSEDGSRGGGDDGERAAAGGPPAGASGVAGYAALARAAPDGQDRSAVPPVAEGTIARTWVDRQ